MSETGRFFVTDLDTGRKFVVEPIDDSPHAADWGDVDPATKKLTVHYGEKYTGSVREEDSIITKENGFKNWVYFKGSYENGIKKLISLEKKLLMVFILLSFFACSQTPMLEKNKEIYNKNIIIPDTICDSTQSVEKIIIQKETAISEEEIAYIKYLQDQEKERIKNTQNPVVKTTSIHNQSPAPTPIVNEIISEQRATLTYVIRDTMLVGETYTIDLTLSKDLSEQLLVRIIDGFRGKNLIDTLITITPVMRARLLDPAKSFTQEPITSEIQSTTGKDLVRWQWQVIPQKEGDISLSISVDNYVDGVPQNVNIYNGKTYVYAIHTWNGDLWNWISTYWDKITYVLGGILTIFAWLYKEKIINIFKKNE